MSAGVHALPHASSFKRNSAWLIPASLLVILAVRPIRVELNDVKGTDNRNWARHIAEFTADDDIFVVTGKWWAMLEYNLNRAGRRMHLLWFPLAREAHPNWLDWSYYDAEKIESDALMVADKAAQLAATHHSTVWVCADNPKRPMPAHEELLRALSSHLLTIQYNNHPFMGKRPYHSFRSADSPLPESAFVEKSITRNSRKIVDYLTMFRVGLALQKSGYDLTAILIYERFINDHPGIYQAHFNLAFAHMQSGNHRQAVKHFLRTLELKPDYNETHYHLSRCYRKLGYDEEAEKHLSLLRDSEEP